MSVIKIIQKRIYDILSNRQSVIFCFIGFVLLSISTLHFGEIVFQWSKEKYHSVFNSFSDNIAHGNFQEKLCQHVPIDAVYTWVNGSDPELVQKLYETQRDLAKQLNITSITSMSHCTYSNCVQSHLVLVQPVIASSVTLEELKLSDETLLNVTQFYQIGWSRINQTYNYTVLIFDNLSLANEATEKSHFLLNEINYTMSPAFLTDDSMSLNGYRLNDIFLVTGIPSSLTVLELNQHLPKESDQLFLYEEKSLAILTVYNSEKLSPPVLNWNFTVNNKPIQFSHAYLVVEPLAQIEDVSSSRFADNEELRYSLRSLAKNAPWIRQVFLVTNGQIPYWLNLDNPRITIVTHEEIFSNQSDLPSFSSPAIESHLHKIPSLSEKFLYLNDDTFFGKQVWPEDFYSHSNGYKVYLSWPVPDCSDGCPTTWIKDGYCDKTCNNSACEWDGGDCLGENVRYSYQQHSAAGRFDGRHTIRLMQNLDKLYCNPSCANSWLSDRYCDQACNVLNCGFDAGDCGTEFYYQLPYLFLNKSLTMYQFPKGEFVGYLNLSLFENDFGVIQSGTYDDKQIIRTVAVAIKYQVLTIVLQQKLGNVNFTVTLKSEKQEYKFNVLMDTNLEEVKVNQTIEDRIDNQTTAKPIIIISVLPAERHPKINSLENLDYFDYSNMNLTASNVSIGLKTQILKLTKALKLGYLTSLGYKRQKSLLINKYFEELKMGIANNASSLINETRNVVLFEEETGQITMRKLKEFKVDFHTEIGFMPWEKQKIFQQYEKALVNPAYSNSFHYKRHLLDTYGDSLRHVNRLYNVAFGFEARKVPAHIPHLFDVSILNRLHNQFSEAFVATSANRIRSPTDMQYAFSYAYFLMSEMTTIPVADIFDKFDTDNSRTWSDREIRTLLTQLYALPLQYTLVTQFEESLINCSKYLTQETIETLVTVPDERYYGSLLPTVTKSLVIHCEPVAAILTQSFGSVKRNKFEIVGEGEVAFKMLHTNLSKVLNHLDEIRKFPKKFVCLNDNIGHGGKDADIVKAVLHDFFESIFPLQSSFELPPEYRNRYLHVEDLRRWRRYRDIIRFSTYSFLGLLVGIAFWSFCISEVCHRRLNLRKAGKLFFWNLTDNDESMQV